MRCESIKSIIEMFTVSNNCIGKEAAVMAMDLSGVNLEKDVSDTRI